MELKAALKAIAPAVGDGKLVWQHAYVFFDGPSVRACNGQMWASASHDRSPGAHPIYVRHESLLMALERDGAELRPGTSSWGTEVRAGRSSLKLKGQSPAGFPAEPTADEGNNWVSGTHTDFVPTLEVLSKFCGKPDNHIWQMGVHFMEDLAFSANPYALCVRPGRFFQGPISIPPWAAKFILAQETPPNVIGDYRQHQRFLWTHEIGLVSTMLIEEPAENIVTMAHRVAEQELITPVPGNLKSAVERAKSLGATRVRIGDNKIDHMTDELEFEDEIDLECPIRTWGVEPLLAALEVAEKIDLSDSPAKWEGHGFRGVFSGMSG